MFCVKMDVKTVPAIEPLLPVAVGPISSRVLDLLSGARTSLDGRVDVDGADPYGLDLQLALYACYELHYRDFAGVSGSWDWDPVLLGLRGRLERVFLDAVRRDAGDIYPDETAEDAMATPINTHCTKLDGPATVRISTA
jgi:hypothetical protein